MEIDVRVKSPEQIDALMTSLKALTKVTASVDLDAVVDRVGIDVALEILEAVRRAELSASVDMTLHVVAWEAEKDEQ